MSDKPSTIVYTIKDEAPLLATASLLPVIHAFTAPAGVKVETSDISVAARILELLRADLRANGTPPTALVVTANCQGQHSAGYNEKGHTE